MADLRESFDSPVESTTDTIRTDVSNAQAVDETPSKLATFLKTGLFGAFVLAVVIVGAASIMKQAFPEWAERNRKALSGLEMKTSVEIVKKAANVDWFGAFKNKNIQALRYVGTGLHPDYRNNPVLKRDFFFQGEVHIMKDYVRDFDMMSPEERLNLKKAGSSVMKFPAIGVDQTEAAEYCSSLGKGYRLPTYEELAMAKHVSDEKEKQKARGSLKPNLVFKIYESKDQWTATPQPADGWFSSLRTSDNYRIFTAAGEGVRFEDDSYDDENLSFRCVKEPEHQI